MSIVPKPIIEDDFTFACTKPFPLDSGGQLQPVNLRYAIYGTLNRKRDNAILVCHALSGSARVADWWPEMFGPERLLDLERHCVIGINIIGSCYGSTGPGSANPLTGTPYGKEFPLISVGDMVRAQAQLLDLLGVEQLLAVIGSSIGGMQALQWAVDFPNRIKNCIAIGAASLSAMGLALNHLQRQAIRNDTAWCDGNYESGSQPVAGLALARAIAVCSYKSPDLFAQRFARKPDRSGENPSGSLEGRYDVAGYLDYQGTSFTRRFDANSYLLLSKAMDTFDLARGYQSEDAALRRIRARMLLVGISSDWLFPPTDILALTERMQRQGVDASYRELNSSHGHDGFLADAELLLPIVKLHLDEKQHFPLASAVSAC